MDWIIPESFPIKGVVFDMDGLMLDTERIVQYSWEVAGEKLGYTGFGKHILNTLGMNRVQRNAYFRKACGEAFPLQEFSDCYHEVYRAYEKEHGIPKKKGLSELLEVLKEKEIPMGVATSTHEEHAVPALKKQGIYHYFQAIVTGNMVQKGKPNPEIYDLACRKLGIIPAEGLAFEDSYNGIRSAYHAGMKVIMIPDLLTEHEPVKDCLFGKMESLLEAAKWLQKS